MSIDATHWAVKVRGISASEARVLWHLADCHNPVRGCYPSQDYLAEAAEIDERTVRRVLASLRAKGHVNWCDEREGNRRAANRYSLAFEAGFQRWSEAAPPAPAAGDPRPLPDNLPGRDLPSTGHPPPSQPDISGGLNRAPESAEPYREPLREPEKESAGAREGEETPSRPAATETPGRADFEKRVQRFCSGSGFVAGLWKNWDSASLGWIAAQFAALSPEERAEAELWRDPYLLDCAARKVTPMGVGLFLRDRAWRAMDPALLDRGEKIRAARLPQEERAKPDGWAACLGPVGMAWLFATLVKGPPGGGAAPAGLWLENRLRELWPAVHQWKAAQQTKGGVVFAPDWHRLKHVMEAVPADCETHAAWKALFSSRGWPWLAAIDGHPVLWAPRGGPGGLSDFEAALTGANEGKAA